MAVIQNLRPTKHPSYKTGLTSMIAMLEPRMMFDGAVAVDTSREANQTADVTMRAALPITPAPVTIQAADPAKDAGKHEVVFIDTSLSNWQALAAGAKDVAPGAEIDLISSKESGLAQIAQWAQIHGDYDAIHILAAGSEGQIVLGTDLLTDSRLSTDAAKAELAQIGSSLKAGGNLLLYGSKIASGTEGRRFITDLAETTGAIVVASTQLIGTTERNGVWALDASTSSEVTTRPFSLRNYDGLLSLGDVALSGSQRAEILRVEIQN
ncbi:hypothetical protein CCP2SC5_120003 [Azospirillaceae bacterium]